MPDGLDVQTIANDPDFHALPLDQRAIVMSKADPDFAGLPTKEQYKVVSGMQLSYMKAHPTGTQPQDSSLSRLMSGAWDAVKAMKPSPPDATSLALSSAGPLPEMVRGAIAGYKEARNAGQSVLPSVASGAGSLMGLNAPGIRERAAKGDVAGVIGEGIPAIAATLIGGEAGKIGAKTTEIVRSVPELAKAGLRKVGNPYGVASTGEELLTQGISPYAKATGFKNALFKAGSDIKSYDAENPIKGVQDLNDAIPEIKQKIWNEEVAPALQRRANLPVDMKPVAEAVRGQISPEMKEFDEANATKLDALATKLENTRDITSANSLLKYVNGQLESYFAKYPSARRANLMANPETAGWEAARQSLRDQFLTTLEDAGESGVRDARLRYGALEEIGKQVERRVNVADRAKPMSINRILGLAGIPLTGGLSVAAGELGHYLNKTDVLIRRGIKKLPESVPIKTLGPS